MQRVEVWETARSFWGKRGEKRLEGSKGHIRQDCDALWG
jgi:hypothetical protein